MANSKKCDRCGQLYEKNSVNYNGIPIKGIYFSTDPQHYAETYGVVDHRELCDCCLRLIDA